MLAWAPLTTQSIWRASRSFDEPFSSEKRCREELLAMVKAGLLQRAAIPDTGRGQKTYGYFLSRGAASLAPEVEEIPRSNSVFHGLAKNPFHALANGELWAIIEESAAKHADVKVLERVRDRQFVALVKGNGQVVPDGTVLVEARGRRKLLFGELVNEMGVINAGAAATQPRSLATKLDRYRRFSAIRKDHNTWQDLERVYGDIGGFQVLVVTTRNNVKYLLTAAEGSNTMFLFADLEELRSCPNVFEEPVWWLPRSAWRRRGPERTALIKH